MRRLLFLILLITVTTASIAGNLARRKAVVPPSGEASGSLSVNLDQVTLKHSYLVDAPGQFCGKAPMLQAYLTNREIDDFTLLSPVRLDQARAQGLRYVLIRLCPDGVVHAVDLYHPKLGDAGYVSLPRPFPMTIEKLSDGRFRGAGKMPTPNLFLNNEYVFDARFETKYLKIEPL
jgi:hypothetical protein